MSSETGVLKNKKLIRNKYKLNFCLYTNTIMKSLKLIFLVYFELSLDCNFGYYNKTCNFDSYNNLYNLIFNDNIKYGCTEVNETRT